ncbi:hypothetical protein CVV73_27200, partial [Enterobacter hormaechei]
LTSAGLLLHRHNLHDLILQRGANEVVHNLALLDGHGEQVNLLQALDFALLHQTAQLGARHPLLLLILTPTATSTAAVPAPAVTTPSVPKSAAEASSCRCLS